MRASESKERVQINEAVNFDPTFISVKDFYGDFNFRKISMISMGSGVTLLQLLFFASFLYSDAYIVLKSSTKYFNLNSILDRAF